jgi:hypothetical protein
MYYEKEEEEHDEIECSECVTMFSIIVHGQDYESNNVNIPEYCPFCGNDLVVLEEDELEIGFDDE